MKNLLIWGAGDQGVVTLDCALAMNCYNRIDFMELEEKGHQEIADHMIYPEQPETLSTLLHSYDEVIVASGNSDLREKKVTLLLSMEIPLATIIHPTAVVSPFAMISPGNTILTYAVICYHASIGTGCIINTAAIVEHDCIIEDFVNISPKAAMAGHVKLGRKSFLGTGCTIIPNTEIGKGAVIGAGAVVIHAVPEYTVAAGVPAAILKVISPEIL